MQPFAEVNRWRNFIPDDKRCLTVGLDRRFRVLPVAPGRSNHKRSYGTRSKALTGTSWQWNTPSASHRGR